MNDFMSMQVSDGTYKSTRCVKLSNVFTQILKAVEFLPFFYGEALLPIMLNKAKIFYSESSRML